MNPITGISGGTPSGANIRKVCVPHACSGTESQVRCSIHSVMRPIAQKSVPLPAMNSQQFNSKKKKPHVLTRGQYFNDELRVAAKVCGLGIPFHSAPASTKAQPASSSINQDSVPPEDTVAFALHKHSQSPAHNSYQFNELLRFPTLWRDLPRDACVAFNIIGPTGDQLYGTTLQLFDGNGLLRTGLQKLLLHPNKYANVSAGIDCSSSCQTDKTPGISPNLLARREFYAGGRDHKSHQSNNPSSFSHSWEKCASNEGYGPEHEQADPLWKACLIMEKLNGNKKESPSPNMLKRRPSASSRSTTAGQLSTNNHVSVPWLDTLTMERCVDVLNSSIVNSEDDEYQSSTPLYYPISSPSSTTFPSPEAMLALSSFLVIELPTLPIPIVHEESCYPHAMHGSSGSITADELYFYHRKRLSVHSLDKNVVTDGSSFHKHGYNATHTSSSVATATAPSAPLTLSATNISTKISNSSSHTISKYAIDKGIDETDLGLALVQILDHENEDDNPVEDKYRTLAHDLIRGLVDPALKPNREQRFRLDSIISSPSHHPTLEEKDLLWRFRFTLVDNRRALTKFLLAVDWSVESEVVQAAELLEQWRKRSPIEVTDALKLLGKHVAFQTSLVRSYAIDTLAAAPDEELRLYLLQLVQALKYENSVTQETNSNNVKMHSSGKESVSSLANFLIDRASKNLELANDIYWYIKVELQNEKYVEIYRLVFSALEEKLSLTWDYGKSVSTISTPKKINKSIFPKDIPHTPQKQQNMSSFLGSMTKLGASLRGGESDEVGSDTNFSSNLKNKRSMWNVLQDQDDFISSIMDCQLNARDEKGKKDEKQIQLRKVLASRGLNNRALQNNIVPLPSAPSVFVTGIVPSTAIMFKSALYPAVIEFCVQNDSLSHRSSTTASSGLSVGNDGVSYFPESHKVIVKTGDDLRQDQLIIMMIRLMDGILKRYTLDLCLKPYSIIATSPNTGLVEFVEGSMPISQILAEHNNSILQFFQKVSPMESAKYKIHPDIMQTYVSSCAGYCVITYLLGVGDRHLDNIMLQPSGHFFHIDFGFIFGRDPKPLPPPFRLTREMVDGMGGVGSEEYKLFCSLACQAYNLLRNKSAALVLNLLHLMSDAGIEDLSNNPSADEEGVIAKVEERFRLELTDEQAESFFLGLINDSLVALAPRVMDVFHSFAVARR